MPDSEKYSSCDMCTIPIKDTDFFTVYFNKVLCYNCIEGIIKSAGLETVKQEYKAIYPKMILAFDLDGTLCTLTSNGDYHLAEPMKERIAYVNDLYDDGYVIKIFTARGQYSGTDRMEFTKKQLEEWGVKYHELISKTAAHLYIDDLAMRPEEFFGNKK